MGKTYITIAKAKSQKPKAKSAVRVFLKDAESAKFSDLKVDKVGGLVCGAVNAKNSFGGYSGKEKFVSSVELQYAILESSLTHDIFWVGEAFIPIRTRTDRQF